MKFISLDHEELMILGCFHAENKEKTIMLLEDTLNELKEARMDGSDDEMMQLLSTSIEKLKQMDDAAFVSLGSAEIYERSAGG